MKKSILILGLTMLVSCDGQNKTSQQTQQEQPFLEQIQYSNLVDEASQEEVKKAMIYAGISQENIDNFIQNVTYYNNLMGDDVGLVSEGFLISEHLVPTYNEATIIERWEQKNPDFVGYNCRITSFGMMNHMIAVQNPQKDIGSNLFIDKNALKNGPQKAFSDQQSEVFLNLYTQFPTPYTRDTQIHIQNVCQNWKEKGVLFRHKNDPTKASLISIFFHSAITPEESELFVGHVGVLLPTQDNAFIFVEKLSFQEPYQAIKVKNRTELNDLLMFRYDVEWGQPTSIPFIFENDELLEGYRPNLKKKIQS